jgi:multidrug efflux system outer membrane protein
MSISKFFLTRKVFAWHKFAFSKIGLSSLLVFLLPSCSFSPRYERPCMEMPEQWRVPSDETETVINVRWWKQLNDPVLDDLIEEALASNKDLRIATARIAQFRAQLGIVSSELYPQLYAQGTATRTRTSRTLASEQILNQSKKSRSSTDSYAGQGAGALGGLLPDFSQLFPSISNDYRAVLTASYEVDLWGRIRNASDASFAELIGQIDARRTVILSLVSSVAASYILLRQYDRQLQISQQTLNSRKQSYDLAKVRFEEGLTSELEVAQALAEMDQAAIQLIQFQTLIPQQENLISVLIGHPPNTIVRGLPIDGWQLPPEVPAGLPSDLLEQRPDILQAEQQIIAANFRIGEARALYFPDITLTGYYGYESAELHRLFTDPSRTWQWMVNLLQPIFTGWRITSTVDLAQARKQEAVYNYLQTILTALQEVDDALIAHKNAKEAVLVEAKRVKDYSLYLHLATLQYQNGLVDYLNVLDAERRLYASQLDLAQGQAEVFITLVNIYKALGGGWVVDAENLMKEEWNSSCGEAP